MEYGSDVGKGVVIAAVSWTVSAMRHRAAQKLDCFEPEALCVSLVLVMRSSSHMRFEVHLSQLTATGMMICWKSLLGHTAAGSWPYVIKEKTPPDSQINVDFHSHAQYELDGRTPFELG